MPFLPGDQSCVRKVEVDWLRGSFRGPSYKNLSGDPFIS